MGVTAGYISDFSCLSGAGIPLVLTRTKEPFKVIDAIRDYVLGLNSRASKPSCLGIWTAAAGWKIETAEHLAEVSSATTSEDLEKIVPIKADEQMKIPLALKSLLYDSEIFVSGFYVMIWPQHGFNDPAVRQFLLEVCDQFTGKPKRLVIVLPPGENLPEMIQDYARILDYATPESEERESIIKESIEANKRAGRIPESEVFTDESVKLISSAGAGMIGYEFSNNINHAVLTLVKNKEAVNAENIAKELLKVRAEIVKRSNALEVLDPINIEDVGGLENLKEWVTLRKSAFSKEAKQFGVDAPKGILLVGIAGNGKSLAAKAIGSVFQLPVIKFDISAVFGGLVGQSETQVKQALTYIESVGSTIVLIDEVEKGLAGSAGAGDSGVTKRVIGAILTAMQESKKNIFWVLTANSVTNLPPELMRKGRIDEIFSFLYPNDSERESILRIHLKKRGKDSKVDLTKSINRSDRYVGAELEAAVKEAILQAYQDNSPVTDDFIYKALDKMIPMSKAFGPQIAGLIEWAENNAIPASKPYIKEKSKKKETAPAGLEDLEY